LVNGVLPIVVLGEVPRGEAMHCRRPAEGTACPIRRSPCMSLRADRYRERAAEAKDRAARARDPSLKSAFEEVAKGWLYLLRKSSGLTCRGDEANNRSVR
jgi:hypothetical protein